MRNITVFFLGLCLATVFVPNVYSQETIGDTDIEPFTYSGTVGFQSHAYTTTQDINRRQPLGGLFTANVDFSVLGLQSGVDIRYSTDDNKLRQSLNKFGFYGSWRWITLSAGDVNPDYANYGIRGTTIRGAELQLTPGIVFIELGFGRLNRSVYDFGEEYLRRPSYERWIYAAKVGVGDQEKSHFSLSGFYGEDKMNSIPDTASVAYGPDFLAPPAENIGMTPKFQVSLFEEAFKIGAETTVSAYTRDQTSPVLSADEANVPSFLTKLYTPRNSTRLSYAGVAHTEFSFDVFDMRAQYERILPGYESMGIRQLRDDQHTFTVSPAFRFFDDRWSLDGTFSLSEDNLLGNRLSTQSQQNLNLKTMVRVSNQINIGGGYIRFESFTKSAGAGSGGQHSQVSQVFQLFPSFTIMDGSTTHNFSITGIYQDMTVEYPVLDGEQQINQSNTKTGAASYSLAMPTGLMLNGSANAVFGDAPGNTFTTIGGSAGAGYALFERKLNLNVTVNVSQNQFERSFGDQEITNKNLQVNGSFIATYSITSYNSLQLNLRSQNNTIMQGDGQGFSEMEARIRFQQRF